MGTHIIMFGEVAIRYGDGIGSHDGIDEAIFAIRQGDMINPNIS